MRTGKYIRKECPRCGNTRIINEGVARRTKASGLCKACWAKVQVQCPLCTKMVLAQSLGHHVLVHHPEFTDFELEKQIVLA